MDDRNLSRGQDNFTARMDRLYPNLSNNIAVGLAKALHDKLKPSACISNAEGEDGYVPFKRLADSIAAKLMSMSRSELSDSLARVDALAEEVKQAKDVPNMDQLFPVNTNTSGANVDELSAQVDRELVELSGINKMLKGDQYAQEYKESVNSMSENDPSSKAARAFLKKLEDDDLYIEQIDLLPSFSREHLGTEGKRARGFLPANFDVENDNPEDYENYDSGLDIPDAVITLDSDGQIHLSCPECAHDDIYPAGDGVYQCFSCPHDGACRGFMNRGAVAVADVFNKPIEVMTEDYKERLQNQEWKGGFKRITD